VTDPEFGTVKSKTTPSKPLTRLWHFILKFGNATTLEPQRPRQSGAAVQALQVVPKSARTLRVITDFNRLATMHPDWDSFVESFAPSPFFLMGLLRYYFCMGGKGVHNFAVVMSEGERPVGLAAFQMMDRYISRKPRLFRFRSVEFLFPDHWTPDFVAQPDHRQEFVEGVLTLLFDTLGCRSASLTLPSESPNGPVLMNWCEKRGIVVQHHPSDHRPRHAVLRIRGTWEEYLASRGRKYVQNYNRSERNLARVGRWSVSSGRVESQPIVDKITEVDRNSWKQEWRRSRRFEYDGSLAAILDYYRYSPASKYCPLFWLLELDGRPIAFSVATILGDVAYMFKASYDTRYKYFAPGKVLDMETFHDIFKSKSVSRVDFFTSYDYMRPWTPELLGRETFIIENHRGPSKLFMRLMRNDYTAKVLHTLTKVEQ
jgi:hypothetical protein